jgi:hypothetical protein
MNSFIIGVCFEKSFAKTKEDFSDILKIMANIRFVMVDKFYDEFETLTIYNRVVFGGDNVYL